MVSFLSKYFFYLFLILYNINNIKYNLIGKKKKLSLKKNE